MPAGDNQLQETHPLVAFVAATYQQALDVWYGPEKLRAAMLKLCPGRDDPLWERLTSGKQMPFSLR